jgi:hypothetical protein
MTERFSRGFHMITKRFVQLVLLAILVGQLQQANAACTGCLQIYCIHVGTDQEIQTRLLANVDLIYRTGHSPTVVAQQLRVVLEKVQTMHSALAAVDPVLGSDRRLKKMIDEVTAAVQAADSRQSDAVIAKHAAIAYVNAKQFGSKLEDVARESLLAQQ